MRSQEAGGKWSRVMRKRQAEVVSILNIFIIITNAIINVLIKMIIIKAIISITIIIVDIISISINIIQLLKPRQ